MDSRAADGGHAIRRRRECARCGHRLTTYERHERASRLVVVKKDGARTPFDRSHVLNGVRAACGKRPVPEADKDALVEAVEAQLHREFDREVPSREIGERVASRLRELDEIAYIRYASEYYSFKTLDDLGGGSNQPAKPSEGRLRVRKTCFQESRSAPSGTQPIW